MYHTIEEFGGFKKLHSLNSRPEKLDTRPPPRPRFRFSWKMTAISPTTNLVALVGKDDFLVYQISQRVTPVCYGVLQTRQMVYRYSYNDGISLTALHSQHLKPKVSLKQSAFSRVALSDSHIVLGMDDKILIFMVAGEYVGQWVYCEALCANVIKLRFSSDENCSLLLALVKAGAHEQAYIFSAESFPVKPRMSDADNVLTTPPKCTEQWDDEAHRPNDVAFSHSLDKIGICTTPSMSQAMIRLLRRRDNGEWTTWGPARAVSVFLTTDPRDWTDEGLTGISL